MAEVNFERVQSWIASVLTDTVAPYTFELIAGGRSNLTFRVTDARGSFFILRRPPTSHVLPTAHDMRREHTILSALAPSTVPTPTPLALCDDPEVAELPFYLMSYVEGAILREPAEVEELYSAAQRSVISQSLITVLANLHRLDIESIGLSSLAHHHGYIDRQLKRWYTQYRKSSEEIDFFVPGIDEVYQTLHSHIPEQHRVSVVHGDYRLDNTVITPAGTVAAVLDWEICTLGDPLADLGLLLVYWTDNGDERSALGRTTTLEGFWSRSQLASYYCELTGADVSTIDFYVAFAYFKLACILQGVYSRYLQGARGGDQSDVSDYGEQVAWLSQQAALVLAEHLDSSH